MKNDSKDDVVVVDPKNIQEILLPGYLPNPIQTCIRKYNHEFIFYNDHKSDNNSIIVYLNSINLYI
jgi:hypothetical protein